MRFEPASRDVGNIVFFEHVNLTIPDQETATDFYVDGLGLTRDPYMMVGTNNMWINAGRQQFHLPRGRPQRFRGVIGLTVPDLDALRARLRRVAPRLDGTRFSWRREGAQIALSCPWGNRFRVHAAGGAHGGPLGIPYLEMPVAKGAAAGIARFYRTVMGAPAELGSDGVQVTVGPGQRFVFREGAGPAAAMTAIMSRSTSPTFPGPIARWPSAAWSPRRTIPTSTASSISSRRGRRHPCSPLSTRCGACTIRSTGDLSSTVSEREGRIAARPGGIFIALQISWG